MIAVNINISEKLINDYIGTVSCLDMKYTKPLSGQIYIKCYDFAYGNSLKDRRLCEELKVI